MHHVLTGKAHYFYGYFQVRKLLVIARGDPFLWGPWHGVAETLSGQVSKDDAVRRQIGGGLPGFRVHQVVTPSVMEISFTGTLW